MEGRGAEVAKRIRESKEWDQDDCRELCNLAGLSQEWEDADGENFEGVVEKAAEAYAGETLEVVNPYESKTFESDADRICSMGDSIKLIADADYFITVDRYWEHTECGVEGLIAGEYGMKRMLAMTEFAAPDVLKKSKNMVRNPYYNE